MDSVPLTPLDPWIAGKIGGRAESVARAELERYQLERLQATLALVRAHSRFYRERLAGMPAEIACLADLARFPFTTAEDVRARALQFLCVSQDDIHRVVTLDTSGTTGQPKRLYFTRDDQELTIDFFRVGMSTFTDPGDGVLILLPCERPGSVGDLLATALLRLGARPVKHGPVRDIAQALDLMRRERIDGLVGIPAQVLALARCGAGPRLKSVLLTTDHVPQAIARAVERAWGCRVYNHYGMTEMGLGGGVECRARRGLHLREADLYFEVVDPATGTPREDGAAGEVVFTTLTRRGMPLIRYRTGDLGSFIPGDCPCGTALKTLACITSRIAGRVALGSGAVLTLADLDEALYALEGVLDFTATLVRAGERDELRLDVSVLEAHRQGLVASIPAALEQVPAIRPAQAAGRLAVDVRITGPRVPAPGKRRIDVIRD